MYQVPLWCLIETISLYFPLNFMKHDYYAHTSHPVHIQKSWLQLLSLPSLAILIFLTPVDPAYQHTNVT